MMFLIMRQFVLSVATALVLSLLFLVSACGPQAALNESLRNDNGSEEQAIKALNAVDNVHMRYSDGDTPLHLAVKKGYKQIVYELVGRGADINARTFKGRTPLALAIVNGDDELAQYFIDNGAKLKTNYVYTNVFFDSVQANNQKMVDYSLNNGYDIDMVDGYGRTALHVAGSEKHIQMIKHLLSSGATAKEVNNGAKNSFSTGVVYKTIAELAYKQKNNSKAKDAYTIAASSFNQSAEAYTKLIENAEYLVDVEREKYIYAMNNVTMSTGAMMSLMNRGIMNSGGLMMGSVTTFNAQAHTASHAAVVRKEKLENLKKELTQMREDALANSELCKNKGQTL